MLQAQTKEFQRSRSQFLISVFKKQPENVNVTLCSHHPGWPAGGTDYTIKRYSDLNCVLAACCPLYLATEREHSTGGCWERTVSRA